MVISFMNFPKACEAMEEEQVDAEAHVDQQLKLEACLLGQTFV